MTVDLEALLEHHFGFRSFRPGQQAIIRAAVAGRDILGVMPTGAGKSLTYQLPALAAPGLTIVVSPLIALMRDQVDALKKREIAAAALNSSIDRAEQRAILAELPRLKLLYLSPERLSQPVLSAALANVTLARLVIDEAHCISEWGHDFRPEYRTLHTLSTKLGCPPITALTATATPRVRVDIAAVLKLREPFQIVTGFDRPNLAYRVWPVPGAEAKRDCMQHFLATHETPGIIYTATRREAEELAARCRDWGYQADVYHGGRDKAANQQVQKAFLSGDLELITATSAFGMGVDKPDVRFVLHYRLPATLEAYYQEAGRAGRDGAASTCTLLFDPDDRALQKQLIDRATPSPLDLKKLYLYLRNQPNATVTTTLRRLAEKLELNPALLGAALKEFVRRGVLDDKSMEAERTLRLRPPFDRTVPTFTASYDERVRTRHELLDQMVGYAAGTHCRRRYLLAYFSDDTTPDPACGCDHCRPRPLVPPTEAERALLRVLATRTLVPRRLSSRLAKTPLNTWSEKTVETLVRQLARRGGVQLKPRLTLTDAGRRALASPRQMKDNTQDDLRRRARTHDTIARTHESQTEPQRRPKS